MAERNRPVYCTRCGSIVQPGDNFCGVCGARVSPAARDAGPPGEVPTQVYAPADVAGGGTNRTLALFVGLGITVLILLAVGAVVALTLLGSGPETTGASRSAPREEAPKPAPAEETDEDEASPSDASGPDERLGVGDSVEAEGVRATLNGVRVLPATDFDTPIESPDNLFVAADLTFENVSDRPVAVSSLLEFVLKNEEGYSASQSIHSQQRQLAEGEISPGQKTSGEIVYEVPPGSKDLQLDYQPFLRGGVHTWYVGDAGSLPGDTEPAPAVEAPEEDLATSEEAVVEAAEDYYQAVDQENWAYTYSNLDSQTKALFAEDEWYLKNQYFSDTEGLELSAMDVTLNGSPTDVPVSLTIYRTFKDGSAISRETHFVREGGTWKHRFTQEEIEIFMPGIPYEDFVAQQVGSTSSASATASASAPSENLDCSDFATQAEAQATLEQDLTDPHRLDADGNLLACEDLPGGEQYGTHDVSPNLDDPDGDGPRRSRSSFNAAPRSSDKDIDCDEVDGPIPTPPGDPDHLDGDGDGLACE